MQLGRRLRIRPVDGQQRDSTGFPTINHDLKPPDLHVQVIWWLEASQLLMSLLERFGRTLTIELQWSLVKLKEASQPGHMTSIKGVIKRGNPGSCGPASPSPLVVPMITSLELFVSLANHRVSWQIRPCHVSSACNLDGRCLGSLLSLHQPYQQRDEKSAVWHRPQHLPITSQVSL